MTNKINVQGIYLILGVQAAAFKGIPQYKNLTQTVDETWYTDVTSQEDDKKVMKSGGHHARSDVTMLTNTAIQDPFTKTAGVPKLDKKERFFR